MVRRSPLDIDQAFFKNYAGSGKSYHLVWKDYCYFDECCQLFEKSDFHQLKRICVLGAATGEICQGFYEKYKMIPYGCELSPWAHQKIPKKFRKRIRCQDMRSYVSDLAKKQRPFDLVFTNALIYLSEKDLPKFLKQLSVTTHFLHCRSSTSGAACPDPWRRTLRPYKWWKELYKKAGFEEVLTPKGVRTYLWKSTNL